MREDVLVKAKKLPPILAQAGQLDQDLLEIMIDSRVYAEIVGKDWRRL